jgi:hypothetical protein
MSSWQIKLNYTPYMVCKISVIIRSLSFIKKETDNEIPKYVLIVWTYCFDKLCYLYIFHYSQSMISLKEQKKTSLISGLTEHILFAYLLN